MTISNLRKLDNNKKIVLISRIKESHQKRYFFTKKSKRNLKNNNNTNLSQNLQVQRKQDSI